MKFCFVSANDLKVYKYNSNSVHEESAKLRSECCKAFIRSTSGSDYIMLVGRHKLTQSVSFPADKYLLFDIH